ncbi:TIGR03915 family putative DNA repair protein [Leeuwenhoekiella marinoflava]|uniref:Probable DNA metabolism protein n=2 Tax=Leeuwenhoekiella marinoflava TaxID=988 RepID=A0ABY1HPS3_9FLAO|nr:TIGR03915 family putative DNA repair protein [Leeuwenhoekiella marinoflava]RXG32089.1 putative DNA metabolism protein [Leeuwenhoekiella marinoflava]SHE97579.1 probable DNA metabolism protein [Leeuwenhoekiella marinoflava DSM 3653]
MKTHTLKYDSTFEGLLTAVFTVYEERLSSVLIVEERFFEANFFSKVNEVFTDESKASRVWEGLKEFQQFRTSVYRSFLSELPDKEVYILDAIRYVLKTRNDKDYGQPSVLKLAQLTKQIGREKHRMKAFVRFKRTKDDVYVAIIEPDFNVLPLIARHFKNRYADQQFVIYDRKRNYGIFYDLNTVELIELDFDDAVLKEALHDEEMHYDKMWQDYFISTGIKSRINKKLHLRHVPKRYWKYLNEKNPL